jgi:protein-L-isoaspartate(D-aspartate) O-methyltransferase
MATTDSGTRIDMTTGRQFAGDAPGRPDATSNPAADFATLRARMVNNQLRTFDITDHRVQDAMAAVERERFVPPEARPIAYSDEAIVVQYDAVGLPARVMTTPAVLGRLIQLAQPRPSDRVLLVGAALGYSAAVLARLAAEVVALEVDKELCQKCREALKAAGVGNVETVQGTLPSGWPARAPYDVVFVDGAVLIEPHALEAQLKDGGRMVLVEGEGLAGRARVSLKGPHGVSSRYAINAAAGVLPGFRPEPAFVF